MSVLKSRLSKRVRGLEKIAEEAVMLLVLEGCVTKVSAALLRKKELVPYPPIRELPELALPTNTLE